MPSPTILIADDDTVSRRVLSHCLRPLRIEIETVDNGTAALARLRLQPVSLLITDVHMPGMDGLEIVGAMREDPRLRDTPVFMISATGDLRVEAKGRALGVQHFFSKPFSPSAIVGRVREVLPS